MGLIATVVTTTSMFLGSSAVLPRPWAQRTEWGPCLENIYHISFTFNIFARVKAKTGSICTCQYPSYKKVDLLDHCQQRVWNVSLMATIVSVKTVK